MSDLSDKAGESCANASQVLLIEEYRTLRSEIQESIKHQHQILLSGYAAALATIGAKVNAFVIAPFVLFVMFALWSAECNRMVRAGYYIAFFLWPELSRNGYQYRGKANWELWVRCEAETPFGRSQHIFQQIVVFWAPILGSVLSLAFFATRADIVPQLNWWLRIGFLAVFLTMLIAWVWLWRRGSRFSRLAGIIPKAIKPFHYTSDDSRQNFPARIRR